jgi:hypothetical protein
MGWMSIFPLAMFRFMVAALLVCHVEAVLTGHMGYDTIGGCFMLVLAGILWAMGDAAADEMREYLAARKLDTPEGEHDKR